MSAGEMYDRDLRSITSENPTSFTHKGKTYSGIYSGVRKTKRLEVGGFDEEPIANIAINLKDESGAYIVDPLPVVGDIVTVDLERFRIVAVERDLSFGMQMDLASAEK